MFLIEAVIHCDQIHHGVVVVTCVVVYLERLVTRE